MSVADDLALPDGPVDALALASDLEGQGRYDEAIDVLMRTNRRRRNATVERELVSLRHRAFAKVSRSTRSDSWHAPVEDRFPDDGQPPEVSAADLTIDHLRSGIAHHGCLIVRRLLDPPHVDLLTSDIDRALAEAKARLSGEPGTDDAAWWAPFRPTEDASLGTGRKWILEQGSIWAVDSPRGLFDLVEVFRELGLGALITEYLGEPPAISVKKCTLRRVPADTGTNWHQDGAFLGADIRTLNVWIALSPCGDDSPSLDVVAKRMDRIVETGTDGAAFTWSVGEPAVERARGATPVVRPRFAAGDAMLFDDMFLHRTGVSPGMIRDRYTIESWFFAPSTYPIEQIPVVF